MQAESPAPAEQRKGLGWPQVLVIVLAAMLITVGVTLWLVKTYIFPSEFQPVALDAREQQVLDRKLENLGSTVSGEPAPALPGQQRLEPEAYSEAGASREIRFSERELNALLANNTDLARRVAIDLSDNLISAKILMPMDADFPILGGRTLRLNTGLGFAYDGGRPVVRLKGVSVMGVPLPNAWLGNLKHVDLVREFGGSGGFWSAFAAGIDHMQVSEGELKLVLKE